MKRIAQLAAVLAITLLVAQPALAGATCLFGSAAACVSGCTMAMDGMGSDCPMTGQMLSSRCPMDCCSHAALQTTEPLVAPEKIRATVQHAAIVEQQAVSVSSPVAQLHTGQEIRSVSPPRYILNQVFRI